MRNYNTKKGESFTARIYVAGDFETARSLCREYVDDGACVQIKPCEYIFTGGSENGCEITLINYMRFPCTKEVITNNAVNFAKTLIAGLHQFSASVVTDDESIFISDDRKR